MKQDVSKAMFDPAAKETFLKNTENPDSGAFSRVGEVEENDTGIRSLGKYRFRLIYDRGLSGEEEMEWTQTT